MNFWQSLEGAVDVTLHCADTGFALAMVEKDGIPLRNVQIVDELTVSFQTRRTDWKRLDVLAQKRGFEVREAGRIGLYWFLPGVWKRPVLLWGLLLLFLLSIYLPSRVLFIQVEGNVTVPTKKILESAAECGIAFGASRGEVRSEKMKNALLEQLPQLQWAGVNTSGCVAIISVRERQSVLPESTAKGVASIVALRDAVVTSVTATKGNTLCKPGQAVKAGQVLISGYTDCGFSIQAVRAEGEVYGETERLLQVITPDSCRKRLETEGEEKKYAIVIGKKRINLYFGSGILDGSCVKIYEESYITLPGGFQLPVALVTEVWHTGGSEIESTEQTTLSAAAKDYLLADMFAGQILSEKEEISKENGIWLLSGRYACTELIGQQREEEILRPNGTND